MTQWVRKNPALVTDADIALLAGLMRYDDEIIRREAAGSIGFVGRRAISAAPALVQALQEQPCSPQPPCQRTRYGWHLSVLGQIQ
jgi:hypothetical protein